MLVTLVGRTLFNNNTYDTEKEAVHWEVSTDNYSWNEIPNSTTVDYQPGPLSYRKYFRRVSTHLEYRSAAIFGTQFPHREYWYTSNTVTISTGVSAPVPNQPRYTACGLNPVTITVRPPADATSYTWGVTQPGVLINGKSTYPTYQVTTTEFAVQVTMPVGATLGSSYPITVTAKGECGVSSAGSTIYVDADCTAPAPYNASFVSSINTSTCRPSYDVLTGAVIGANSYTAIVFMRGSL